MAVPGGTAGRGDPRKDAALGCQAPRCQCCVEGTSPHLAVHLSLQLFLELEPAVLLARHPARHLLHHLGQPLHARLKLAATDFVSQGGFVCFLATGKGRRAVGTGCRDNRRGEVATWSCSPHHPRGVGPTSRRDSGSQRDLARDLQPG